MEAIFLVFLQSMLTTMLLIVALKNQSGWISLIDKPNDKRKIHPSNISRVGGLAMSIATASSVFAWLGSTQETYIFFIACGIIVFFGVWDDKNQLDYRTKLVGQALAAIIVIALGAVEIQRIPFFENFELPIYIRLPLTFIVIVAVTNAINLADGLDGLAGGIVLLSLCCIVVMAMSVESLYLYIVPISIALMGALLGFLRFNTHPASVFMGDTGSQLLGFCLAVLCIKLTLGKTALFSIATPLLVIGLPLVDTIYVMYCRLKQGRSPFSADNNHIHHRLLNLGYNNYEAVSLIYITQIIFITLAYNFRYETDWFGLIIYIFLCSTILIALWLAHNKKSNSKHLNSNIKKWLKFSTQDMSDNGYVSRGSYYITNLFLTGYIITSSVFADNVSKDVGLVSLGLIAALVFAIVFRIIAFYRIEHAVVFILSTFCVYLTTYQNQFFTDLSYFNLVYFVLTILIWIAIRFNSDKFPVTPLDILAIFVLIMVPQISLFDRLNVGAFVPWLIVVFYSVEVVFRIEKRRWDILRIGVFAALSILGIRGFLLI